MTTRTSTAIYDSESEAREARAQLVNNGLDDDDVRIVSQNLTSSTVSGDHVDEDKGVWESIKDFFVGDDDRPTYSEGLRRGGYLLTARVEDEQGELAIALLEQTNAVDLDERAEQWRAEGWSGEDSAYIGSERTSYRGAAATDELDDIDIRDDSSTRDEQAIPVVEERLRVGKREIDRGGVRVRSYVVEEPVHEEVSLRQERVEVERRPASGRAPAQGDDRGDDLFREQTIEVSERGEEAVVAKDAVVTGEVVVRKTTDERTQSIDETVRRTEVDVDDTRGGGGAQGDSKGKSTRNPRSN
jgi:uncharacterized protein (TIGR02271 family)